MRFSRRAIPFLLVGLPFGARSLDRSPIKVVDTWSRSTPPAARTGVVYMTIRNEGSEADALLDFESPVAARVELHQTVVEKGVARMIPVPQLEVPGRSEVKLEPNGLHLMLVDLRAPLVAGQSFPVTMAFRSGYKPTLEVSVRSVRGTGHAIH